MVSGVGSTQSYHEIILAKIMKNVLFLNLFTLCIYKKIIQTGPPEVVFFNFLCQYTTRTECLKDLEKRLNSGPENIYQWLVSNKLTLNLTKTEYMIIGSRHRLKKIELNPEIKIGSQSVKGVKTTKCLGMIIDDKLRWEGHIDHISKKVSRGIGAMKLIKPYAPKNCLNHIYNALVKPYLIIVHWFGKIANQISN